MFSRRIVSRGLFAFALCVLSGCVSESSSENGSSFHYQYWLPVVTILGGLICVPIGFFWRKSDKRLGWGLMTIVPLAACLMAPNFFFKRVWVDDQGFEYHSGVFVTTTESVKFDSVKAIRVAEEETGGRRSRQIEVLYFDMKAGGEAVRFPLDNDIKIEAAKEILARAKKHIQLPQAP